MSLEQNPAEPALQDEPTHFHAVPRQRRLAKLAYRLAHLGPLAFLVMALCYPPANPNALPGLPVQILWWTLCLCSPIGAILGAGLLVPFYRGTLGSRRVGIVYAMGAVCVGGMASLALVVGLPTPTGLRRSNYLGSHTSCASNLKQLETALLMYAQDNDDHYPPAATWNEAQETYTKAPNSCSSARRHTGKRRALPMP